MYILFLQFTHELLFVFYTTLFECKGNLIQRETSKKSIHFSKTSINFQTCLVVAHEEAKTQLASLEKELFEIAELQTLTTKSIN